METTVKYSVVSPGCGIENPIEFTRGLLRYAKRWFGNDAEVSCVLSENLDNPRIASSIQIESESKNKYMLEASAHACLNIWTKIYVQNV